ncbi:MAG: hypothetical protein AABX23_04360 [Nanoarchaeota archaeon]
MKKNSQLHLYLETDLLDKLKKIAEENKVSVSEICRRKIKEIPQLNKIELTILEMDKKIDTILNTKQKVKIVNIDS